MHLIDTVRPTVALVSAEDSNRYAFPHPEVLSRYASRGIPVLNTAHCGGIRITSDERGIVEFSYARRERAAIWRYPAAESCKLPGFRSL